MHANLRSLLNRSYALFGSVVDLQEHRDIA